MTTLALSPMALLGLGFLLGLRHALDPDHVITVTAMSARAARVPGRAPSTACSLSAR